MLALVSCGRRGMEEVMCMLDDVAGCSEQSNFRQEEVPSADAACTGRGGWGTQP